MRPEISRRSLRTALRFREGSAEPVAFQPGGWIELATVEDESSPFPEGERLTLERLQWIAEAVNSCPECPAIRSNWQSPDPTIGAHEAVALPPLGFIEEAKIAGPVLWGRVVEVVRDGIGQVQEAIRQGFVRRSLGFLAGNDPEAPNGWGMDHLALLGSQSSGQRMLGLPDLDPALLRSHQDLQVCTRSLEGFESDPAEEAASKGGPAAEEEFSMTPEEIAALAAAIGDAVAAKIEPMMAARNATPEPTPEERATAEAAATEATARAAAWETEVTTRLDNCVLDRRLSARDRPALVTSISTMGREKGEPELRAVEQRTPLAAVEPLHTSALSQRNRDVLAHLPAGVRIEETNIDRTLSYVEHRNRMNLKPGQPLTREQAQELLAVRAREQAG